MNAANQNVIMLPPEALLADSNIRFGLKKFKVEDLAERILEAGRVETNLKVEELPEPGPKGETHRVREGHYRCAATALVNKKGAGILLPCEVVERLPDTERMMRQISENMDREDLSPMDVAVAAQKLLDTGMSKVDIRKRFSRPGGRKGVEMKEMSNALLNIYLDFLDFPKDIQNKIHDGRLPVGSAYELHKQPKEKWQAILDRAEADRQAAEDADDKLEQKYLESLKKEEEREAKAKADQEALVAAEKIAKEASSTVADKLKAAAEAYTALQAVPAKDKEALKKAKEAFEAKEADAKAAKKIQDDATAQADKLRKKAEEQKKAAKERAEKLAQARKDAENNKKAARPEDIKRAAAKETGGPVPLNANEMRQVANDLALPSGFVKTQKVGDALKRCFAGVITDKQLLAEIAYVVGDRKEKPKHVKETKEAAA